MRRASLQAIRSRVQRLSQACGTANEERLVIHWMNPYDNCLNCGYDLDGHAFKQAVAEAEAKDGPDPSPSRVVFYWWPKTLTTCPRCGCPLPTSQK